MKIESHRDLIVWQKSMAMVVQVYQLSTLFPNTEIYRFTSQIIQAAASVLANIAEAHTRGTTNNDFAHFFPFFIYSSRFINGKINFFNARG